MSTIPRQLGAILDVLGLEWTQLFGEGSGQNRATVVTWLYRTLDTLDNKTAQLLRFLALLLAAQTFLSGFLVGKQQTPVLISILVLLFLLIPLAAGISGLSVFKVEWPFFGYVREKAEQKGGDEQLKKELHELAKVCDRRVDANRRTFYACWVSAVAFAVTLVLTIFVVAFR